MHHPRRLIASVTGCAVWCIATAGAAFAKGVPDPHPIVLSKAEAPLWQFLSYVALAVLLAVAIVGLGHSLSHSVRLQHSPRSRPPLGS